MQAWPMLSCGVRLSVCLSRLYIVSKRVIAFFTIWNSHTIVVFPHQMSWQYSLNAGGVSTNRNSGRIAGYRSMTAGRASNNCDGRPCSLSHRRRCISESLFITSFSMDEYAEEKKIEQNLIVRSGKSEAEVTNNKRRRSRYSSLLLKLTTDRDEASRGLSATAELLISIIIRHRLSSM